MLRFFFFLFRFLFFNNWGSAYIIYFFGALFLLCNSSEYTYFLVSYLTELDYTARRLVILSFWVTGLCLLRRQKVHFFEIYHKKFVFLLTGLIIFLFACFSFNDFFYFYFVFECSVIPILFLILGWGYQPERLSAGVYMFFYTIFASLPLLVVLFNLKRLSGTRMLLQDFFIKELNGVANFFLILAFLVKFPIYITHLWLPKAHVEAPVAGSMILAGVMLKLGGYGIIRVLVVRCEFPNYLQNILVFFSIWGGLLISLTCLNHIDIKSLVACSSVVHIRTCIRSLIIFNEWGKNGAVLIIIAHGLCSSGLFFLVGTIYNLTNSRRIVVNKGLLNNMPSIRIWWFLLLAANIACPPTINLLSEIEIISSILNWRGVNFFPLAFLAFFRCAYRIYLFSLRQHGKYIFSNTTYHSGFICDYLIAFIHWAPLNLFILFSNFLICFLSL